jgi:hypothetical protein
MVTIDLLRDIAPKKTRAMITQDLVDKLNGWNEDPKLLGAFKDNVLSYMGVLKTGKYRIEEYMNAVRFVSYKLIGHSDIDAYAITFPDRYQRLVNDGVSRGDMAPYVSIYRKTQLVVKVFEQSIVPSHVLNAPMHQEALNIALQIATNGKSEVARVQACNTILSHTKPPETTKIELDIGTAQNDAIAELKESLASFAAVQLLSIERGQVSVKELGALKPKEEEFIEGEIDG